MNINHIERYKNKKILILGGSILQLEAIKTAKSLGCLVGVVDYNPNAIGVEFADIFFNVSTTDVDAIEKIYRKFTPDSVFTMATDMPMRVIGYLSDKYGLNYVSYNDALVATNKYLMIQRFKEYQLPHPKFLVINSSELSNFDKFTVINGLDNLSFPLIVKPVDSSGSRGVNCAEYSDELFDCIVKSMDYSNEKIVIIEELLVGSEVSVEVLVYDSTPTVISITDKETTGYPNFVEISHLSPSKLSEIERKVISKLAVSSVKALNIINGAAHVEIMLTKSGPYLIEVGARLGGDFITSHLVPYSTGYDIVKGAIDISLRIKPKYLSEFTIKPTKISFFTPYQGNINFLPNLDLLLNENVLNVGYFKSIGDYISTVPNSSNRLGYYIVKSDSYEKTKNISMDTLTKINELFRSDGVLDEK